MTLISVIIPCYNSEQYVERAINSVLKQSFKDYEIILVDNNSTDNTPSILQKYVVAYPNFIRLFQEPKKGAPFARNKGLLEAKSEWLQFLDSDDELLPEKLYHQFELAKTNLTCDIVVGDFYKIEEINNEWNINIKRINNRDPWEALLKSHLGKTSSMLWKKNAIVAAGGWNEKATSSQEYDLLFRLLQNDATINYLNKAETYHYVINNSISRSDNEERKIEILNNFINLRISIKDYLISNGNYSKNLKFAFNTSIYNKLQLQKKRFPGYVEMKLKDLSLKLPLSFIIRNKRRKVKNIVTFFLGKIITSLKAKK